MIDKALFTKTEVEKFKRKYDFSNDFVAEEASAYAIFLAGAVLVGMALLLSSDSPR